MPARADYYRAYENYVAFLAREFGTYKVANGEFIFAFQHTVNRYNTAAEAKTVVNSAITTLTGKPLKPEVVDRAWQNLTVTTDPIAASLQRSAENAVTAGLTAKQADLHGIYDLSILNRILTQRGLPTVSAGGLGKE